MKYSASRYLPMDRLHVIFRGRVQGVWFRANCQKKAMELGVNGWVRNLLDGSVEALIEGERDRLMEHLEWCRFKQPLANVTDVEVQWMEGTGEFTTFMIDRKLD